LGKIRRAFEVYGRQRDMNEELIKDIESAMIEVPTNLTWADEESGVWKGWTYSPEKNRYYFDDIGNESLLAIWNDPFLAQAETK
jgi:hypothetical protein